MDQLEENGWDCCIGRKPGDCRTASSSISSATGADEVDLPSRPVKSDDDMGRFAIWPAEKVVLIVLAVALSAMLLWKLLDDALLIMLCVACASDRSQSMVSLLGTTYVAAASESASRAKRRLLKLLKPLLAASLAEAANAWLKAEGSVCGSSVAGSKWCSTPCGLAPGLIGIEAVGASASRVETASSRESLRAMA